MILGLFSKKKLEFEKIKISNSKINSDKTCTITFNVKNFKETFDKITATIKTDDLQNQYLRIDKPTLELPSLSFPNHNTGDHSVMITPFNIPLSKMSFQIALEIFTSNNEKPSLHKKFNLTINKKSQAN